MSGRIEVVEGDLTAQRVDAVVNAANSTLLGGGGVDGALHAVAGPALLEECRRVRAARWHDGLPVGQAVATGAGDLPCRHVIHTVGPDRRRGQDDPELLASCLRTSLAEAVRVGARSVAVPAISAGVFAWPVGEVARILLGTARAVLDADPPPEIDLVRFVLLPGRAFEAFRAEQERIDGPHAHG